MMLSLADIAWGEILELVVRWAHITIGIAWIGSSFYFNWLDNNLNRSETSDAFEGDLWSVHGGGVYHKKKFTNAPAEQSGRLHWFKYEAYFTWVTGILLLGIVYYLNSSIYLIDEQKLALSGPQAIAFSISILGAGWVAYHMTCKFFAGRKDKLLAIVLFSLFVALSILVSQVLSDKAAYIQMGAVIGTIMSGNVFWVIIPNQKKMLQTPPLALGVVKKLGEAAKLRSVHNNYLTLPILFIMISNHYPVAFAGELPWFVLACITLSGVSVRHFFNIRHKGQLRPIFLIVGGCILISGFAISQGFKRETSLPSYAAGHVSIQKVQKIIGENCVSCHAVNPTDVAFDAPPNGIILENYDQIFKYRSLIYEQVVVYEAMPMGKLEPMKSVDRQAIASWYNSADVE